MKRILDLIEELDWLHNQLVSWAICLFLFASLATLAWLVIRAFLLAA